MSSQSRGAAADLSHGHRPWWEVDLLHEPRRGERVFRPCGARLAQNVNHGRRLRSAAATRLNFDDA